MTTVEMTDSKYKEWLAIKEKARKDTLLKTLQGRLTKQQRNYFDKTFWNLFDSVMIEKIVNVLSPPSVDTATAAEVEENNDVYDIDDGINGPAEAVEAVNPFTNVIVPGNAQW